MPARRTKLGSVYAPGLVHCILAARPPVIYFTGTAHRVLYYYGYIIHFHGTWCYVRSPSPWALRLESSQPSLRPARLPPAAAAGETWGIHRGRSLRRRRSLARSGPHRDDGAKWSILASFFC